LKRKLRLLAHEGVAFVRVAGKLRLADMQTVYAFQTAPAVKTLGR